MTLSFPSSDDSRRNHNTIDSLISVESATSIEWPVFLARLMIAVPVFLPSLTQLLSSSFPVSPARTESPLSGDGR